MAKAKANAKAKAKAPAVEAPKGYQTIGGRADSWKPEENPVLQGEVTGAVKHVNVTMEGETKSRRCCKFTTVDGERFTIWESAALDEFFDHVEAHGIGGKYFIRFDGLGEAKPGQNAPKLFTVAAATRNPF